MTATDVQRRADELLVLRDLRTQYYTDAGPVRAVDGVTFGLRVGETLGVVGESGSGKSVTALSVMRLVRSPGAIVGGSIDFDGEDVLAMRARRLRRLRGGQIAMIFQDPMTSLNPTMRVGDQLAEAIEKHGGGGRRQVARRCEDALREVGIGEVATRLRAYPHELSGGMRQRVMIAMALACDPKLLIADEPTTALDVTIQAQILELIRERIAERGTALLLISHDLGVIAGMCERVHVMYAGRIVESAATDDLYARPRHPYTAGLLRSVPRLDQPSPDRLVAVPGQPPDLRRLGPGCPFAARCDRVQERCRHEDPPLSGTDPTDQHTVACWYPIEEVPA